MTKSKGFGSICTHEIKSDKIARPHILPIYATSSFSFDSIEQGMNIFNGKESGYVYGRYGNPTIEAVAKKIASLEVYQLDMAAEGLLFSSGMAAITCLFVSCLKPGDKVLTQGNLYGGTTELLIKILHPLGIEPVFMNLKNLDKVADRVKHDPDIRLLYFETPANPTMACVDIEALASIARTYNRWSVVDNTFSTPYLQRPFRFGIDFVIHSTTKYLNGHGTGIAGILLGKDIELMKNSVWQTMKLTGGTCNPFDAWLINNGLKTLELRMMRHTENALAVALFLEKHPAVKKVNYNGLLSHPDHHLAKKQMTDYGGILSFELQGGLKAGIRFMNNIRFCTLAPTLGDIDTLILHPASMSHANVAREIRERNGITDGLIRLSVGIENVEDIIDDLEQALS